MGACVGKEAKPAKNNVESKRDDKPEKPAEKPAESKVEPKKEPAAEREIPQGEPIKLDELDEDFILFEPIEEHYELGEEIGKCVVPSTPHPCMFELTNWWSGFIIIFCTGEASRWCTKQRGNRLPASSP
jgi:hypothetical protein